MRPNGNSRKKVMASVTRVDRLNSLVLSTYPPITIPPTRMASSNPAPARLMDCCSKMPPLSMTSSINAPTIFVMVMDATKAARGG